MHNAIKEVFLLIMMTTLALVLYWVFFGQDSTGHKGVLYWLCYNLEAPIAQYYYNYCYLPNVHNSDYIDLELGVKMYHNKTHYSQITMADYNSTALELPMDDVNVYNYPSNHYSAGWD